MTLISFGIAALVIGYGLMASVEHRGWTERESWQNEPFTRDRDSEIY